MSNNDNSPTGASSQNRRGSVTTQAFNSIFGRSNSTTGGPSAPFPGPITTAAAQDQRRRMSISTLGLSGTSPTQAASFSFGGRRGSISTDRSGSVDESAIDDDDSPGRRSPNATFRRRMSSGAQALRAQTGNANPGSTGRSTYSSNPKHTSPLPTIPAGSSSGAHQASMQSQSRTVSDSPVSARPGESGGFNWSEQLRSRAESSVSQSQRPSFSTSPGGARAVPMHERARSVSEMPTPPVSTATPPPPPAPARPARKQPDAFQERILKGDFYMD